jgi:branched-chain amino acid transport system substrate-binding protein
MKIRQVVFMLFLLIGLSLFTVSWVQAEKPITIGCPLAIDYLYGWDGVKLAVEEINAKGGVVVGGEKRPFEVVVMDTRDLAPGVPVSESLMTVEKLILQKKADFLIGGPVRSEAALATMPLLNKYKTVSILTTGSLSPKIHQRVKDDYDTFKYQFRIHGEAKQLVKECMACLMQIHDKYNLNRLFIMPQDVEHARKGGEILGKVANSKGWKVTGMETYPTGTGDFSQGLLKVKKTKAEVISLWMDMPESSILLKQWYDLKIPALPFGSTLCAAEQPGFWEATDGKGEYCLCNVVNAGNAPSNATSWTMEFYNAYKDKWGISPEGLGTSSSYMAVYVLKDAIERAETLDTDQVIKALEKTDMMGVYGRIRFDPKSHQVIPSNNPEEGAVGSIVQWQNGKRIVVYPKSIAQGEIKLPPWMKK